MVTAYYKSAFRAFVYPNGEWHLLPVAAFAAHLARVSWIYSFKRPASVFSFAFRHREKASPSYIADCLGKMAILDHPANVQILDSDRVKASDQIGRNLVVKILATARDFQVRFGDFDSLLQSTLRSFLFSRKSPLLSLQIIERILEMARIFDFFAVRECGETANANVYADSLSGWLQGFRFRGLANDQSIPAINTACDAKLFALSFDWAGEPDSTTSNAGNCELVALERARSDFLVFLRESVVSVFSLEPGKSRLLSILNAAKKPLESLVYAFKRVLLDRPQMAFYFRQRASFSQMARLLDIAERLACDLITRDPFGKSGVIELARMFKFALAGFDKTLVDAKLEFIGLDYSIFGIGHCVTFPINIAQGQELMSGCSPSSCRFVYTTIDQPVKQQNSEGNAQRTRE
jgi:hypothetical protein